MNCIDNKDAVKRILSFWPHYPQITKVIGGKCTYAPHYFRWRALKSRCYSPNNPMYYLYGERGILVCEDWKNFWNFLYWVLKTRKTSRDFSIDRINPDGNYSPENCRWATPLEQQLNARYTENKRNACKKAQQIRKQNNYSDLKFRKRDLGGKFC